MLAAAESSGHFTVAHTDQSSLQSSVLKPCWIMLGKQHIHFPTKQLQKQLTARETWGIQCCSAVGKKRLLIPADTLGPSLGSLPRQVCNCEKFPRYSEILSLYVLGVIVNCLADFLENKYWDAFQTQYCVCDIENTHLGAEQILT